MEKSLKQNFIELPLNSFKKKIYSIAHFLLETKLQRNAKNMAEIRRIIESQEYEYLGQISEERNIFCCREKVNDSLVVIEVKEVSNKNKCIYLSTNLTSSLRKEIRKYFMMKSWRITDKTYLQDEKGNGIAFIEYNFVETNLRNYLSKHSELNATITEAEKFALCRAILESLCFYHLESIAILDIRPQTILFEDGKWFIMNGDSSVVNKPTEFGASVLRPVGTKPCHPHYCSPLMYESWLKDDPGILHNPYKSDVYSLGLILWEIEHISMIQPLEFKNVLENRTPEKFHSIFETALLNIREKMIISNNFVMLLPNVLQNMLSESEEDRNYIIEICLNLSFTSELFSRFIVPFENYFPKQVIEFPNSSKKKIQFPHCNMEYEGESLLRYKEVIKHGRGTVTLNNIKTFEGEWHQNIPHGKCNINFGGSWNYEGQVYQGALNGSGVLTFNGIRIGTTKRFLNLEEQVITNYQALQDRGYYFIVPEFKNSKVKDATEKPVEKNAPQVQYRIFYEQLTNCSVSYVLNMILVGAHQLSNILGLLMKRSLFIAGSLHSIKVQESESYQRYNASKFDLIRIELYSSAASIQGSESLLINSCNLNSIGLQKPSYPAPAYNKLTRQTYFVDLIVPEGQGTLTLTRLLNAFKADLSKTSSAKSESPSKSQKANPEPFGLDLSHTKVKEDELFEILQSGCCFSSLNLSKCSELSDNCVRYIFSSKSCISTLRELNLSFLKLTDKSLEHFKFSNLTKNLKSLNLSNCTKLTNEKLSMLLTDPRLSGIETLEIAGLNVTHHGVEKLTQFGKYTAVSKIDIGSCHKLGESTLSELFQSKQMRGLKVLECYSSTVKDSFLEMLANESLETPQLEHLNFSGAINISMYGISKYFLSSKSKGILNLNLSGLEICDSFLELIAQKQLLNPQLSELNLSSCHKISDKGLKSLLKPGSFLALVFLDLSKTNTSNDTLLLLSQSTERFLRWLRVCKCNKMNDLGFERFMSSPSASQIRRLEIGGTSISAAVFKALSLEKYMPRLIELCINECSQINEASLKEFFKSKKCATLSFLDLSSTRVSHQSLSSLHENPFFAHSLLHLKLTHCLLLKPESFSKICIPNAFRERIGRHMRVLTDSALQLARSEVLLKMNQIQLTSESNNADSLFESNYAINIDKICLKWFECNQILKNISKNPYLGSIKALELSGCKFAECNLIALIQSPSVKNVQVLDLSWTQVSNDFFSALSSAKHLNTLRHLNLSKCISFNDKGLTKFLMSQKASLLTVLDLRSTLITNCSLESLGKSKHLKHLSTLILKSCPNINEVGFRSYFSNSNCSSLRELDISWSRVNGCVLAAISRSKLLQLNCLRMAGIKNIEFDFTPFTQKMACSYLVELDLSYAELTPKVVQALSSSKYLQALETLELIGFEINQATFPTVKALIKANLNKLTKFKITNCQCSQTQEKLIQQIQRNMLGLEKLFLIGCCPQNLEKWKDSFRKCQLFSEEEI